MDVVKFNQAAAMLGAFADNLPKLLEVQPTYINKFHAMLDDIQNSIDGLDLNYFKIRDSDLKHIPITQKDMFQMDQVVGYKGVCPMALFKSSLYGAIRFINGSTAEPDKPRQIGFCAP